MKSKKKLTSKIGQQPAAQLNSLPHGYAKLLEELKTKISLTRVKAALAANREMVILYWHIGKAILDRQQKEGWGAKIIDRLSTDLTSAFPNMKGFSPRNLKYMRSFAETYSNKSIVQQVAAQIPWFHNCVLLDKVSNPKEREWYLKKTIEHGWSRNILSLQIESHLFQRQGKAITNFKARLPESQSDLASEALKDPYLFDFLTISDEAKERDLEKGLLNHIQKFLIELGQGFAFSADNIILRSAILIFTLTYYFIT